MLPRDVKCPHCGATKDWPCRTVSNTGLWRAKTHLKRWKAIGIPKPSTSDMHRDYVDGKSRDEERNRRVTEELQKLAR